MTLETYLQDQLIESIRIPSGPRQTLILNIGSLSLEREKWKHLANRIVDTEKAIFDLFIFQRSFLCSHVLILFQ